MAKCNQLTSLPFKGLKTTVTLTTLLRTMSSKAMSIFATPYTSMNRQTIGNSNAISGTIAWIYHSTQPAIISCEYVKHSHWTEKLTNEEVLVCANEARSILTMIWCRKHRLLGHVLRHDNLLHDSIEGKRWARLRGVGKGWSYCMI